MNVIFSSSSGPVETSMGKAGVKQLHSALAEVLTDTIPPLGEWGGGAENMFSEAASPSTTTGTVDICPSRLPFCFSSPEVLRSKKEIKLLQSAVPGIIIHIWKMLIRR